MPENLEAKVEVHSSNDSPKEAPEVPQAETVIQAAVQTGAAKEAAESAAQEAKESAQKAETFLDQIRSAIQPELAAINERLKSLEEMEAEEEAEALTIPAEEGATLTSVSAETVTLEEPPKAPESIQTKQEEPQQGKRGGGGFLRKVFLNR